LLALARETKANVVYCPQDEDLNFNQAAVVAVGSILGIDKKLCLDVFREFKGIEHRLEYVAQVKGVKFINDSKSTTVDSTVWALKNIPGPVVLISGGRDKGNDYSILAPLARARVKRMIVIGESKEKIKKAFKDFLDTQEYLTLQEAVKGAFAGAEPGDYVLLSPMCSSFDMFLNYEERGNIFKKAVYGLMTNSKIQIPK
jgi:UDP-N-acetylmuramoylalanine--D-glutamate ligase